jgi:hypothetical protein
MVSDGERYRPISTYLRIPLSELLVRLRRLDRKLAAKDESLPPSGVRRRLFDVGAFLSMLKCMATAVDLPALFGEGGIKAALMAGLDLLRGRKIDTILKERTHFKNVLTLMTIPYEDKGGLEDARLRDCPAVFAYEDVDTGRIRTTAFCSWQTVKDDVCRRIQDHYDGKSAAPATHRHSEMSG